MKTQTGGRLLRILERKLILNILLWQRAVYLQHKYPILKACLIMLVIPFTLGIGLMRKSIFQGRV